MQEGAHKRKSASLHAHRTHRSTARVVINLRLCNDKIKIIIFKKRCVMGLVFINQFHKGLTGDTTKSELLHKL